jgi:DeoR/GlpR family transcriptional regulator of sugar metabolism
MFVFVDFCPFDGPSLFDMLAQQRHDLIVDAVRTDGSVRVRDLAQLLDVSEMTVRRDLDRLAEQGLIDKVHGGATRAAFPSADEPGFDAKLRRQEIEKANIAEAAAAMVKPGSSLALSAGTTTWTLAKQLLRVEDLTVVTNCPSIAQVFYRVSRPDRTVVLTGGVRTPSDALVGPIATAALASLHVDLLFMGVHGMDPTQGFSTPNLAEAEVNRALVGTAKSLVVVADHTKWGTQGLAKIVPLEDAATVVTDDRIAPEATAVFEELDVEVELVAGDPVRRSVAAS